jgi:hypothetical protein
VSSPFLWLNPAWRTTQRREYTKYGKKWKNQLFTESTEHAFAIIALSKVDGSDMENGTNVPTEALR